MEDRIESTEADAQKVTKRIIIFEDRHCRKHGYKFKNIRLCGSVEFLRSVIGKVQQRKLEQFLGWLRLHQLLDWC